LIDDEPNVHIDGRFTEASLQYGDRLLLQIKKHRLLEKDTVINRPFKINTSSACQANMVNG
jgi:hypothetical protein